MVPSTQLFHPQDDGFGAFTPPYPVKYQSPALSPETRDPSKGSSIYAPEEAFPKKARWQMPKREKDLSGLGINGSKTEVTTVMIKGIPCKYSQNRMIQLLDKMGFEGKYDFMYLPHVGKSSSNLGYAFVNFVEAESVPLCTTALDGLQLDPERSVKTCRVIPADIQGLDNLKKHFKRTAVSRSTHGPRFLQVQTAGNFSSTLSPLPCSAVPASSNEAVALPHGSLNQLATPSRNLSSEDVAKTENISSTLSALPSSIMVEWQGA